MMGSAASTPPPNGAEHYRRRAAEIREQAKRISNADDRGTFEKTARLYDKLADDLEKSDHR
ncbi:MAG: hypothetical protein JO128_02725 [Alphaproteobacteria bacterium]|nr:hypothetical protein [Alphaproteobacteria bacterium]